MLSSLYPPLHCKRTKVLCFTPPNHDGGLIRACWKAYGNAERSHLKFQRSGIIWVLRCPLWVWRTCCIHALYTLNHALPEHGCFCSLFYGVSQVWGHGWSFGCRGLMCECFNSVSVKVTCVPALIFLKCRLYCIFKDLYTRLPFKFKFQFTNEPQTCQLLHILHRNSV